MPIIIREFLCHDCGAKFESSDPVEDVFCPHCAGEAERAFFTPPAIKSPQTARKDEITKDLAQTYGFSNLSNKDGAAVVKGQRGPANAHAAWGGDMNTMVAKAANAPATIVDGVGFQAPRPQYVGKVKG